MGSDQKEPRKAAENPSEPVDNTEPFPIVGIGASAGGLEALKELLGALPPDTGMAFVVVQHLDPTHESALAGLLSSATGFPVSEVTQDMAIEVNHLFVMPPNADMEIRDSHFRLAPRTTTRGQHMPIEALLLFEWVPLRRFGRQT